MIAQIGLTFIIIGWLMQLKYMLNKKNEIQFSFVSFYALGVALLVVDGFQNNLLSLTILNSISLLASILVLFKLKNKNKKS
jgi:hypothetical protein